MTRREEEAAWSRVFREIPESEIREEHRAYVRFLWCVWAWVLLCVGSVAFTIATVGSRLLD